MSTIEKLSIQGIRSFGSHHEDTQSIAFTSPVTLILGENGCGKTTIIECLKYALTGELPPGGDRGKNFVHDPKIFSLSDCMGQIKLQVRDINGATLSVCRSMKISQKKGKSCFETLDATVNYMKGQNSSKVDSISHRLADVDTLMSNFMGVSRAIINNVLLCHQEDSSWPLDEAKKLKEKFDAIFGITEYNKAIEKIIKLSKDQAEQLKVMNANLKFLTHLKQEMEDKQMALQNAEKKAEGIKDECVKVDESMKPIEERLAQIRKIELEVSKYQAQKVELDTKQNSCREQIENLKKKIKSLFAGSLDDLDHEIDLFDQKMLVKAIEKKELEENLSNYKNQEKTLQKTINDFETKLKVSQEQLERQNECINERFGKLKLLCDLLETNGPEDKLKVLDLMEDVKSILASKEKAISTMSSENEKDDQERQTEIESLKIEMTKIEESILSLQKQKSSYEKEASTNDSQIKEIELGATKLKTILNEMQKIEDIYNQKVSKFDQEACRKGIADCKEKVSKLGEQFKKIDERLTALNSISKLTAEISLKEKELEKKEQEVRRIKNKHSDNFPKVFSETIEENYRRGIQQSYEKFRREIKELNEKSNKLKLQEQSFEMKRKNLKKEISTMEKDLEEAKEQVYEKCHSASYETLLTKAKETVAKLQLDHGAFKSSEAMYKKYIQKINESTSCPLCHKDMSNNEASDLTQELSDEIQQLPSNINRTENQLKAEQNKYEKLLQLKPVIEKMERLEKEIPQKKEELKKLQENLNDCQNECESLQMALAEPTLNLELANSMLGDMSLLDEALKEIPRIRKDIEQLKSKIPEGHDTSVSIDDLQLEKVSISGELENERKKLDSEQHKYEQKMEVLNKLKDQRNSIKDKQFKLQENIQSLPQLKERREQLHQSIKTTKAEIAGQKEKVQPLKSKLNSTIAEKSRVKEANRKKLMELQRKFEACKNHERDLQRLHNEFLVFEKLNVVHEIELIKDYLTKLEGDMKILVDKVNKCAEDLDQVKTECLNQESSKRDLKDNRELKILEKKEMELGEQKLELTKLLGNMDFRSVAKEKSQLIEKKDAATVKKGELLGQIGEVNSQIKKLAKDMEEPKYKDSLQNYRRAFYEVEVTRLVIEDLAQYRVALEWALMKFHEEKMTNINRLIREYWRLIYRGNDIDYIHIKTEDDDQKKSDSGGARRRNYNYRVVQSKNGNEIEMRGRCSAGQRVLASLIIRMALAETFSTNCGVLALDEPTTNLDRQNIISLCDALNRIVEERQMQSNFMLIIITHDEAFISTLGKIQTYCRVFRNDDCKSVIRRVRIT